MNSLRRLLRNVPVLRFGAASTLAVLIATSALLVAPALFGPPALATDAPALTAPFAASPGGAPALPPGITPQQAEAAKQAIQAGAPIPAEAKKALEARPDLKEQLPPEIQKKLEGKEAEGEAAKKPAAPAPQETPPTLPAYDWRTSTYVGSLFSKRLFDAEVRTLSHFGHEVFAPRLGTAATLENMPVTPDYVVGPGDEVIVRLWGRMEGTHRMVIDRDGKIFFPKIGSL
ncbi:MAG: polysaccharide biosynthesis/export family protein, partial [Thermodesulfobacteriota bacterium]